MPVAKKWYQSKTIWFNIGTVLLATGTEYSAFVELLNPDIQADVRLWLALFSASGNAILRVVTTKPLVM